jgi:hypothetical protein
MGLPVDGLIPAPFWSPAIPPGKQPRTFVRNNRDQPRDCPLWHPDDLTDWVDHSVVAWSARDAFERLHPKPTADELVLKSELIRERISSHRRAALAYVGSDAAQTRRLLKELAKTGHHGRIAADLFRTQEASSRAKSYRGGPEYGKSSDLAYEHKAEIMKALCRTLFRGSLGMRWGWGIDAKANFAEHVLYVDIPTGQVSFHSPERFAGPDYPGRWDGVRDVSHLRIQLWCDRLLAEGSR